MRAIANALALGFCLAGPCSLSAQEAPSAPQADEADTEDAIAQPEEGRLVIDILAPPPEPTAGDRVDYEACIAEQDAARIRGEIIVCRKLGDDAESSGFDKQDWERRHAARTQGAKNPNVAGAGGTPIYRIWGSAVMANVTVGLFEEIEAPLIIDVEALPEPPPGSDADRVANGLPPRNTE
ncbi:MAG: hypothetical protein QNI87_13525 [Erythrobacter sp.]|uniref:hypothetical protein n=1 Tax=Erythrobacter sp. TaxID=1042 RepID=UPI002604DBBF|nr:hypothetical protein [Erythrobacter sp.]MDJ0979542.1 hypothetical protein [Erythrobacter sp.]